MIQQTRMRFPQLYGGKKAVLLTSDEEKGRSGPDHALIWLVVGVIVIVLMSVTMYHVSSTS